MQYQQFTQIRERYCRREINIQAGKMMSSEAITYRGKVFAFFSTKQKMVFKLGKDYDPTAQSFRHSAL